MSSTLPNILRTIRANFVISFVLLTLVFVNVFAFYLLQEKFRKEKGDIIRDENIVQIGEANDYLEEIHQLIKRGEPKEDIKFLAGIFLREDNIFYRVEFWPFVDRENQRPAEEPSIVCEYPEKKAELNDYSNCLFTRTYSDYRVLGKRQGTLGMFRLYNATPKNVPQIESLVRKYRLYAGAFFAFTVIVGVLMMRRIVLPLQKVSRALETMHEERIPALKDPSTSIERAYNNMARNARLTQLGVRLDKLLGETANRLTHGEDPVVETARGMPSILCENMGLRRAVIFHRDPSSDELDWGFGYDTKAGEFTLAADFAERIDLESLARKRTPVDLEEKQLGIHFQPEENERQRLCALAPVFHNNRPVCYVALWASGDSSLSQEFLTTTARVRDELEETFLKVISRRSQMDQEKNAVSIHLSTNLGHDLTNILATGKWDLNTLKKGIDRGIVQLQGEELQVERYMRAVQGLVENNRMLQEIVNIYRAFGYTDRPTFEKVDVENLISELSRLFVLSTSKNVEIETQFTTEGRRWVLEPRLMKLVLFNLFTNSVYSISNRQVEDGSSSAGKILIETRLTPEGWFAIEILDSGTGFRDETGNSMNRAQMRKIFRYGYTTKKEDSRGGLGLSWVWTIVTEFHRGQIIPSNRPEGGARMTIMIPPLDLREVHSSPLRRAPL